MQTRKQSIAPPSAPDFDPITNFYRWLEYLTFGPILQQTRLHFLPRILDRHQALILGDGDGRFLAQLLLRNRGIHVDAVDTSATMLQLLQRRAGPNRNRLRTHHTNALTYAPTKPVDLVVTHFFLDCLTQPEVDRLTLQLAPALAPGTLWLVSDFRIPQGILRIPARLYVRLLYLAFRVITGLRTTHLPDHADSLTRAGLNRIGYHHRLFGILTAELWQTPAP